MRGLLLTCLLLTSSIYATELAPWFGKTLLPHIRTKQTYQHVPHFDTPPGRVPFKSENWFSNYSLAFTPTPKLSIEAELATAHTQGQSFGIEDIRITGRYLFASDLVGDAASISLGITAIAASHLAVQDILSFHHSEWEWETHMAMGKEWVCERFWTKRVWGFGAFGLPHHGGSPWIKGKICYEKNYFDEWRWGLFGHTLLGLGSRPLTTATPFTGYGFTKHRSCDVGAHFTFPLCDGELTAEYSFRVWARNYPSDVHEVSLTLNYPFNPL